MGRRKGRRWIGLLCIAAALLLWYGAEKAFPEMQKELPEGVLLHLPDGIESGETDALQAEQYDIEMAERYLDTEYQEERAKWLLVQKKSGDSVYFRNLFDLTQQLFGREQQGTYLDVSAHKRMLEQIRLLCAALMLLPVLIWLLNMSWKGLCRAREREWKYVAAGVLVLTASLAAFYYLTGYIQLPRQFLPPDMIFDISYYTAHIRHFFLDLETGWKVCRPYRELRFLYLWKLGIGAYCVLMVWMGWWWCVRRSRHH